VYVAATNHGGMAFFWHRGFRHIGTRCSTPELPIPFNLLCFEPLAAR
jgi:hypothetical protein